MSQRNWIGIALMMIAATLIGIAYVGVQVVLMAVGVAAWTAGAYLVVPSPVARRLSGFEALARWWQFATLAIVPPILLIYVWPSWQSGVATFGGNLYGQQFNVPYWSAASAQQFENGDFVLNASSMAFAFTSGWLYLGWWVYTIGTGLLALIWIGRLFDLRLPERLQWLGYVGMMVVVLLLVPSITRLNIWFGD